MCVCGLGDMCVYVHMCVWLYVVYELYLYDYVLCTVFIYLHIFIYIYIYRTTPMLHGGGQEGGVRSGTESIALIVGLGEASRVALLETRALCIHMLQCKLVFINDLKELMSTQEVCEGVGICVYI